MAVTATAQTAGARTTIPALDGLRAIAVVAVVLFHSGHLSGGFLGVDLFFVLSGFLITGLLLDEHAGTGTISLIAFWARRTRRLVPALVLMIVATLTVIALLFDLESVQANRAEALASLTYVSNWWTIHEPAPFLTVFQHTWSLSIEAQFYLVWPVVLSLVLQGSRDRSRSATRVLALSVAGVMVSAILMKVLYRGPDSLARVYFGTDARAVPILCGAALAAFVVRARGWSGWPTAATRRRLEIAPLVVLVLTFGLAATVKRTDDLLWKGDYLIVCAGFTLLVAAAAHAEGIFAKLLSLPPVRGLGLISYGVYLWHWPVMFIGNANRLHLDGWPLLAAQALLTLAIATASYHVVEVPIRQRRRPFARAPEARHPPADALR